MLNRIVGFHVLLMSLLLFGISYLNAGLLTPRSLLDTARRTQGGGASPANLTAAPFHVLLLSSVGRSGSTFLGELLSQRPRTVFMFEPELFLQHKSPAGVTAAASRDLIHRMLACDFSEEWSAWAKTRKNVWEPDNHDVCDHHVGRDYHQCLREICRSNVFKVIKTIKLRVWWAGEVLLGGGVKVVHLVRDPRASFMSLHLLGMVQADYKDLEMVSTMRALFPESFTSVKYEDLCRDPWGTATKLWNFISNGSTFLPESWRNFLHHHTKRRGSNPFGTERDTRQQIGAWREKISERMLLEVEHHCGDVIDILGHTRFGSLANVRNTSIPLDGKSGTWAP
ncbi:carbohydrate sulfotransferase 4 [Penaeus vannamei]|uniref:carbohydrate sulfotransferase 4 n=1 Tax=Penaeus vannamei TaxID=6689 RepID=UPI00387F9101